MKHIPYTALDSSVLNDHVEEFGAILVHDFGHPLKLGSAVEWHRLSTKFYRESRL